MPQPLMQPSADDVLVVWNRAAVADRAARRYEAAGAKVLVAENGYLGREWRGSNWYAISIGHHNGAGSWYVGGPERAAELEITFQEWRPSGREIVVLAQRGIGERGVSEPAGWSSDICRHIASRSGRPVRIRKHPGRNPPTVSLQDDIANAWACVTWGSSAGLHSLLMGVPVFYGMEKWIGAPAALPVIADLEYPKRQGRKKMLERLAWAMWSVEEIETGKPFRNLGVENG